VPGVHVEHEPEVLRLGQMSGSAEPAALPLVNPIEAVCGSLPYGEAGARSAGPTLAEVLGRRGVQL
jgi:hypothetical protein